MWKNQERSGLAENNVNTIAQQTLDTIKIVVLAAMLVIGMQYVFASPPASATPPACPSGQPGCDAPVNVGGTDQSKIGGGFGADWLQAFSIATLNTIGGTDVQIGGTANGIKVLDGDIATSNGDSGGGYSRYRDPSLSSSGCG
ncbi:MAG: hypothetical protein HYY60_01275 [Parcubacteria group bacterium]|nr:hypothetical protein [Parcubacteria group bacterium]